MQKNSNSPRTREKPGKLRSHNRVFVMSFIGSGPVLYLTCHVPNYKRRRANERVQYLTNISI